MLVREVKPQERQRFNSLVSHPLQSWEWGEFKRKTGVEVVRIGVFEKQDMKAAYQLTIHRIPKVSFCIGYFPKGPLPDKRMLSALIDIGSRYNTIFIKLEPNIKKGVINESLENLKRDFDIRLGKAIFTPYTFQIDLTLTEEELMSKMKTKTRYNINVAQRNGITVEEDNSTLAFETYLKLIRETAKRQRFYAHDEDYHRKMWETLYSTGIAHLLVAKLKDKILTTWVLFIYKNILYYPYGASANEFRNLMPNNLIMWEAMRFGKRLGCNSFDLWGSLGPNPNIKDPWFGFHRFKEGYGGELVEFVGAYDLVLNPQLYFYYRLADNLRWKWLRLLIRFR